MALTKQQAAANARAAKAAKLEAAADVSAPEPRAEANDIEPTSYVYNGGLNAVEVFIESLGTTYEFRKGEPVHLAHPVEGLDGHPDFERVEAGGAQ